MFGQGEKGTDDGQMVRLNIFLDKTAANDCIAHHNVVVCCTVSNDVQSQFVVSTLPVFVFVC